MVAAPSQSNFRRDYRAPHTAYGGIVREASSKCKSDWHEMCEEDRPIGRSWTLAFDNRGMKEDWPTCRRVEVSRSPHHTEVSQCPSIPPLPAPPPSLTRSWPCLPLTAPPSSRIVPLAGAVPWSWP